ncbi:alpha-1-acid glycoprotein 2 isoform X1 [Mus musculus]|uniref:alpha-1-acid glycoprotein 2 isoform X1 n=1 Tax=Mus musculus TaxID=10090 RepID=UPI001675C1CF|nr:alpha-1-acid glycoprotein 2 isoform X1 [Mus musculus]
MALHMILVMVSLLPLLEAQNPEHVNITIGDPITNETLSWLSDKWFFIGAAVLNPDYRQEIQKTQMVFFNLTPNLINDTMELREYHTIDDHCVYNSTHLGIQRENGTLSKYVGGVKIFADLIVLKMHGAFMLAFDLKDEKKRGLSLNGRVLPDLVPSSTGLTLDRPPTSHIPTWLPICWTLSQHNPGSLLHCSKKARYHPGAAGSIPEGCHTRGHG